MRVRSVSRFVWKSAAVVGLCLGAVMALGCAFDNYPSVHFNTLQPDFGRPPRPLSVAEWGEADYRPVGSPPYGDRWSNQACYLRERWEARGLEALANARRDERAGRFEESIEHYRNALKHGAGEPAAIRDRMEVRNELTGTLDRRLLREYLAARRDYESFHYKRSEARMKKLAADPRAGILRAHALYVRGAIEYDRKKFHAAAGVFERVASLYPRSPRRESALIMVARSLLRSPATGRYGEWIDKPLPKGDAVERSRRALQTLLRDYPGSRFRRNALSWLARADYVQGRRVAALESYLRQYAMFPREYRGSAGTSVFAVSGKLTPAEAKQLGEHLRSDPSLLSPYLDLRLYHSLDPERELSRLADLASDAARRHRLRLPVRIAARLAEIEYRRGRYGEAVRWANRALSSLPGEGKDLALYVRGASYRRMGRTWSAEHNFERLLRQYPTSYLCGSARENLALLYERRGRPDLALDQYFRLGYDEDIAYALDANMTTDQVAAYLRSHPRHAKRDLLTYTLAIRQLRDNRLADAAKTLASLPDRKVREMMSPRKEDYWWESIHTQARDPRKSVRDLARLERAVSKASEGDARAAAIYAQASYIYRNRDLLFYNAALWHGNRSILFGSAWDGNTATARDRGAVHKHHYEHECLWRARKLCLRIAEKYPRSPVAPRATYRAACATHYLASFNDWWRSEADRQGYWDQSVRLMKRVYQKYPHDRLAKSARKYAAVFAGNEAEAARESMFAAAERGEAP